MCRLQNKVENGIQELVEKRNRGKEWKIVNDSAERLYPTPLPPPASTADTFYNHLNNQVCIYVCIYVCMYVCMYVCVCACVRAFDDLIRFSLILEIESR